MTISSDVRARLSHVIVMLSPSARGAAGTDLSLSAPSRSFIVYCLRFKIERSFKQATRLIGGIRPSFLDNDRTPLRYRNGNQHLHCKSADYRSHVKRKMRAYHVFIQAGVVAEGLLRYLAVDAPKHVRTIRPGIPAVRIAADVSRLSPRFPRKRFSREIHRRSARHRPA